MTPVVAQGLSGAATLAGVFAAIVGPLVAWATYQATKKSTRGGDLEKLQGTLSKWSQDTIADLRQELLQEEARRQREIKEVEARCRVMVAPLRAEHETSLAIESARAEYWKQRALGIAPSDDTPPPDAREGT